VFFLLQMMGDWMMDDMIPQLNVGLLFNAQCLNA